MLSGRKILTVVGVLSMLAGSNAWAQAEITVEAVPEIAKLLPKENRDRGTLRFGATSTNLPAQYTREDGELVGVAIEMYKAAAQLLDVEAQFDVVTLDALQPGIDSGRYDIVTLGDSIEREKVVDIISLYSNGAGIISASATADAVDYQKDLCGHSVAVTKGSLLNRIITQVSDENCVANGKDPVEISSYVDNAGVALAVTSEQDEFGMLELVVALAYSARSPDSIKVVGQNTFASSGPSIKKGNEGLRDAFHAALRHLVETGVYEQVMTKYGVQSMMVPELPINLAGTK